MNLARVYFLFDFKSINFKKVSLDLGCVRIAKLIQTSDSEIKIGFATEKNLAKNLSDLKILRLNLNNLTKRKK